MTPKELYELRQQGKSIEELATMTGRSRPSISQAICRYAKTINSTPKQQKTIIANNVEKELQQKAILYTDRITKQFNDIQELNQLGINKAYELVKLGGEEFGTGMGALNLFASAVYRFRENVKAFQEYEGANNRDDSQESETNLWEMCSKALEPSEDEQ